MSNDFENYFKFVQSLINDSDSNQDNKQSKQNKPQTFEEDIKKPSGVDIIEEAEKVFLIEQTNITARSQFTPKAGSDDQDRLPIHGLGRLDNLVIISNSNLYDVNVAVDDRDVVDDSYDTLNTISNELEHVSAYSRNNSFVVVVTDYPFEEGLHIRIRPRERMTFSRVRVEGVLEHVNS